VKSATVAVIPGIQGTKTYVVCCRKSEKQTNIVNIMYRREFKTNSRSKPTKETVYVVIYHVFVKLLYACTRNQRVKGMAGGQVQTRPDISYLNVRYRKNSVQGSSNETKEMAKQ